LQRTVTRVNKSPKPDSPPTANSNDIETPPPSDVASHDSNANNAVAAAEVSKEVDNEGSGEHAISDGNDREYMLAMIVSLRDSIDVDVCNLWAKVIDDYAEFERALGYPKPGLVSISVNVSIVKHL
jgi:hypothetical protein